MFIIQTQLNVQKFWKIYKILKLINFYSFLIKVMAEIMEYVTMQIIRQVALYYNVS